MMMCNICVYRKSFIKQWYRSKQNDIVKTEEMIALHFETNYTEFNRDHDSDSFLLIQAATIDN